MSTVLSAAMAAMAAILVGGSAMWAQAAHAAADKPTVSDRKAAADGITEGWLLDYPWPDQDDPSQSWRKIAGTLVLSRRGKVIRKVEGESTFWNWSFWHGGREVVYQEGPVHGPTDCVRMDVASGKVLTRWHVCGDPETKEPAWVQAADGSAEGGPGVTGAAVKKRAPR